MREVAGAGRADRLARRLGARKPWVRCLQAASTHCCAAVLEDTRDFVRTRVDLPVMRGLIPTRGMVDAAARVRILIVPGE